MRQQLRQPDGGPVGRIKRLLSQQVYSKKDSYKTALSLTEKRQKAARQMKSTMDKKEELLTLTPMMMKISENQLSQSQVHVTAFQITEG
jgi:hypothetical protein